MNESPLYTVKEATAYLRVSERSLYNRRCGNLPLLPLKIGARTLYKRTDLDAYIDSIAKVQPGGK